MRRVTVLLTGVPQYVTLTDLSFNLDRLFNTDEIGTFEFRNLPNHPVTNKRRIALDFRSGFEAMAAQEKLDGYQYELVNGREYTLHAKINRSEDHMRKESQSPERRDGQHSWPALDMMADVSDGEMYRAHAKLDAQLELLKKQKLLLETEREILREKRRLKREYGRMGECDSENEASTSKRSRSREHRCSSRPDRSRSRDLALRTGSSRERNSQSKERGRLPQIEWHRDRELSSHSGDRCSRSREIRSRGHRYRSRNSGDRRQRIRAPRDWGRSRSRDRIHKGRTTASLERDYQLSTSSSENESLTVQRNGTSLSRNSRERVTNGNQPRDEPDQLLGRGQSHEARRSRTPERSVHSVVLPQTPQRNKSPRKRPPDTHGEDAYTPPLDNITRYVEVVTNKDGFKNIDKDDANNNKDREHAPIENVHNDNATVTRESKKGELEKRKDIQEKEKTDTFNSKILQADQLAARVEAISKDIMVLMLILLDEIISKDGIMISDINKKLLDRKLEALIQERVDPLARHKNETDCEILKNYQSLFPKEDDVDMLKVMLAEIPKFVFKESEATVTSAVAAKNTVESIVLTDSEQTQNDNNIEHDQSSEAVDNDDQKTSKLIEIIDVFSNNVIEPAKNNNDGKNLAMSENNKENSPDNKPQIKKDETIPIIYIDSADKPLPRRPMFVLIIRKLSKDMIKVIKNNKLQGDITPADLRHVLRYIIKDLVKGHVPIEEIGLNQHKRSSKVEFSSQSSDLFSGYMTRDEIMKKFRGIYPKKKDLIFVKNVIKDIKDGKYPGLGPNLNHAGADNDCEDDVVLIEKHIDVVTVPDSDDEDVAKKPIEKVDLTCEPVKSATQNTPIPTPVTTNPVNVPTNHGPLKSNLGNPSPRKPDVTNPCQANRSQPLIMANTILVRRFSDMPSLDDFGRPNPSIAKNNPGPKLCQSNPSLAKHGMSSAYPAKSNLVNSCQANNNSSKNTQTNVRPVNSGQTNPVPMNSRPAKLLPENLNPTNASTTKAKPGEGKQGPAVIGVTRPNQAKPGPVKQGPVVIGVTKPNQAKPGPGKQGPAVIGVTRPNQAKPGPVKPKSKWQAFKEAKKPKNTKSLQQLESLEMQDTAEMEKVSENTKEINAKDKQKEAEDDNNSNNLKVTAITIMTSLDEIARSLSDETDKNTSNERGEESIEKIKEELDFDNLDTEAFDNSEELDSDKGPQVTSITIMTTKAELFSVSQDGNKMVNEIKSENTLDCDAEQSDVTGSYKETVSEQNSSAIKQLEQAIASSDTQNLPLDNTPLDDEDETIESIIKYVASLL